jgi:hypothetical protein
MAPENERRQTVRIATGGLLNVESERPGPSLRLIEVGVGGFRVESSMVMPINAVRTYRFTTADRLWSGVFRARTIYCQPEIDDDPQSGPFICGCSFVLDDQPPSVLKQIASMVDLVASLVSPS